MAVFGFGCVLERLQVVHCTFATGHSSEHWWTKKPKQLDLLTNLLRIFDVPTWILFSLSMICVCIFIIVASFLGRQYNMKYKMDDVVFIPFRFVLLKSFCLISISICAECHLERLSQRSNGFQKAHP